MIYTCKGGYTYADGTPRLYRRVQAPVRNPDRAKVSWWLRSKRRWTRVTTLVEADDLVRATEAELRANHYDAHREVAGRLFAPPAPLPVRTSTTHPLRIDWVRATQNGGRLGLTIAPGRKGPGAGWAWDRDLDADLAVLRSHGCLVVSLLEDRELGPLGISDYYERAAALGIEVLRWPLVDNAAPDAGLAVTRRTWAANLSRVLAEVRAGRDVILHCMGGLGRSGTVAAAALVATGYPARTAIRRVRMSRGRCAIAFCQETFLVLHAQPDPPYLRAAWR